MAGTRAYGRGVEDNRERMRLNFLFVHGHPDGESARFGFGESDRRMRRALKLAKCNLRASFPANFDWPCVLENITRGTSRRFRFRYIASMSYVAEATEALNQAESVLRGIVAKAASGGDYSSVVQIASWAQAISELVGGKQASGSDASLASGGRTVVVQTKSKLKSKSTKEEYPKFFRRGEQLVRVAWSKRDRSEYQHKTSKAVIAKLAEALADAGNEGKVFSTDEVLPVQDDEGHVIPAYQAYVCISLFKQVGLIDQHGRQGYSITTKDFVKAVDSIWHTLPDKLPRRPR